MRSFGTLIQEAPTNPTPVLSKSVLDRFADVAAYATGQMPPVNVGERYQLVGTDTEVVALRQDGGQVALYDPTASTLTWTARRDLAAHVTHLGPAEPEILDRAGLATLLASVFNTPLDHNSVATAGALVDLLGLDDAYEYLDGIMDFEFADGEDSPWTLDTLLSDARLWQREQADEAAEPQHVELTLDNGFWPDSSRT
jgi:hypothetical protein